MFFMKCLDFVIENSVISDLIFRFDNGHILTFRLDNVHLRRRLSHKPKKKKNDCWQTNRIDHSSGTENQFTVITPLWKQHTLKWNVPTTYPRTSPLVEE